jgi:hypothetical protein
MSGAKSRYALTAAVALLVAATGPSLPIREARWLASGRLERALSDEPAECLVEPAGAEARRAVAIRPIAFRAPLLLGGQAARAGMSCATCHRNGRGNPDFLFPGLSGPPGTADVTSSLMSSHRGDHVANPVPIPDLGGPPARLKVSRDPAGGALERFIHGLVAEEFDGPEPSPEILAGLAAYVRALRPEGCGRGDRPITLASRLADVEAAVALARDSRGETRRLLLAAARSTLGAIDERFPDAQADRALLRHADADLAAIRAGRADFVRWDRSWPSRRAWLLADQRRSLFDPTQLRRALH